jgi:redox-sensitive bicupin YhaK (pirin superfamily)
VRVIAGASHGVAGAVQRDTTLPLYLDLHFDAGASFAQVLPPSFNAFVYVYRGQLQIGGELAPQQRMAILKNEPGSDGVILHADAPVRALLIAGQPLHEPIVQYGPFVMNTQAEIFQAINDFNEGRLVNAG